MNSNKLKELSELFTSRGFNPVIGNIYKQQEKWLNWYRGDVNDFHYYQIKTTNGETVDKKKPSLQMGKKVCEDWSSLLFNENSKIVIDNEKAQDTLNSVLENNFFGDEFNTFLELTAMNGTGVIIEYIADEETKINFSYGNHIMVISYENTTPTEIAVIQEFKKEKMHYTHVTEHTFKNGIYQIEHQVYESKVSDKLGHKTSLTHVFSEKEVEKMRHVEITDDMEIVRYYVEYETGVPHFQIFKYPIANNFDVASPMGVSVFANSIDPLGGTDTAYHSWWEDNENSRKKVFVDDESTGVNKKKTIDNQGNVSVRSVKYVDKDQTMFQTLDLGEEKMKIYTPDFSTLPHEEAIQMNLNLVAFKCSLGTDYYNFKDGSVYVNEKSVLSSTSDLWRNRQKAINRLKEVLGRMAYSILFLEKKIGNYNGELTFTIKVSIDDSIVEDDESKLAKVKSMAESGWIPPYIYTAKALKISVKEAAMLYAEALGLDEEESKRYIESLENGEE